MHCSLIGSASQACGDDEGKHDEEGQSQTKHDRGSRSDSEAWSATLCLCILSQVCAESLLSSQVCVVCLSSPLGQLGARWAVLHDWFSIEVPGSGTNSTGFMADRQPGNARDYFPPRYPDVCPYLLQVWVESPQLRLEGEVDCCREDQLEPHQTGAGPAHPVRIVVFVCSRLSRQA
jgi:hypothetical protein